MFGLTVNNFIDLYDKEDYKVYMINASTMDINDILKPRTDFNPILEEPMDDLHIDDDEPIPSWKMATPSLMANHA